MGYNIKVYAYAHAPIAAPDDIIESYRTEGTDEKAAVYSGTIDNTDRAIGRLLSKLEEIAPAEDTLIIYASDNGSYLDDRTGGLRGKKGSNWDGGIRVPGIFYWPGTILEDRTVDAHPAGLVDVLPTVCGLLQISSPEGVHLDGADLSPIFFPQQATAPFQRAQPLFWHLQKSRPVVAMRDGKYSLVADPDYDLDTNNMFQEQWIPAIKSGSYTNYQLYDLADDPQQENDISAEHPEILDRLRKELLQINASIMADGPDWHLPR